MLKCPKCQATLPDGATRCQFCGNSWGPAPGPRRAAAPKVAGVSANWIWTAYYGIAAWWLLDAAYLIFSTLTAKDGPGFFGTIILVIGAVQALVALGLILKVELARGIVNVLCFLQILDGIWMLGMAFLLSGILGIWGIIGMLFALLRIGFAVLMIFLIGETESRAPNF